MAKTSKKEYMVELFISYTRQTENMKEVLYPMLMQMFDDIRQKEPVLYKQIESTFNYYMMEKAPELMKDIFYDYFSEEELDAYIKFYSSPAGQKLVSIEYLSFVQKKFTFISEQLLEEIQHLITEYTDRMDVI